MGSIKVPESADYVGITIAAGGAGENARLRDNILTCINVTDDALKAALNKYDHMSALMDQKISEIRAERNRRLVGSDGMVLRELDLRDMGYANKLYEVRIYRQALRDIPNDLEGGKIDDWNAITAPEELAAFEPMWPALK